MMAYEVLPECWEVTTLGELFDFTNGVNADRSAYGKGVPFANVLEIVANEALFERHIPGRITLPSNVAARYRVHYGDILFNRTSETQEEVGLTSVYLGDAPILFGGFVFRARPKTKRLEVGYSKYVLRAHSVREQIIARGQGGIRANIGQRDLKRVRVVLPPPQEQRAITQILNDADALVDTLERLITKKQGIRQGMMQQLLVGKTRLPGYTSPWRTFRISELLRLRSERNTSAERLTVLSCTKHRGFVRSMDYFRNQVFSRDLTGYRVIYRGDIGYPANHVEEGSIGVQNLEDRALVSPIYVVMEPKPGVDSYFLQRMLKLDAYRQKFSQVTNASVDRRGSLRWPEFSTIEVVAPDIDEQRHIGRVLHDVELDIAKLEGRLRVADGIKQGIIQELLTGRTRLPIKEEPAA